MRDGLLSEPKELGAVWLYDDRGSQLYEEVTQLSEYYLPRREEGTVHGWDVAGVVERQAADASGPGEGERVVGGV